MSPAARTVAGVALVAALAAGLWVWRTAPAPTAPVQPPDAQAGTALDPGPAHGAMTAPDDTTASLLATGSLRGTQPDGEVRFDAGGRLVVDLALRRYFDYYLSLIGETDLVGIRALLRRDLSSRFDAARTDSVLAHFERYAGYLQALSEARIAAEPDPAKRFAATRQLRRERLGAPMAIAFFAEEEALAELSLRRMRIATNPALSPERKQDALAALDQDAGYVARETAMLPELAAREAEDAARRGLSAEQRAAEHTALWGADAAQRLAVLDAQQADWDQRVRRYADARSRIQQDANLTPAQRDAQIERLRASQFTALEQRRIASLEAVGQLEATLSGGP